MYTMLPDMSSGMMRDRSTELAITFVNIGRWLNRLATALQSPDYINRF